MLTTVSSLESSILPLAVAALLHVSSSSGRSASLTTLSPFNPHHSHPPTHTEEASALFMTFDDLYPLPLLHKHIFLICLLHQHQQSIMGVLLDSSWMRFGPAGKGSDDWVTRSPSVQEQQVCRDNTCIYVPTYTFWFKKKYFFTLNNSNKKFGDQICTISDEIV